MSRLLPCCSSASAGSPLALGPHCTTLCPTQMIHPSSQRRFLLSCGTVYLPLLHLQNNRWSLLCTTTCKHGRPVNVLHRYGRLLLRNMVHRCLAKADTGSASRYAQHYIIQQSGLRVYHNTTDCLQHMPCLVPCLQVHLYTASPLAQTLAMTL